LQGRKIKPSRHRLEKQLDYVTAAGKKHRLKNRLEEWLEERLEHKLEE
jgi:hypothetical protein